MMEPGYYDVEFTEVEQVVGDDGNLGPEFAVAVKWPGARVLMMDGEDAIVEHYPVGWRNVERRIDRVTPAWKAKFTKVDLPGGA